MGLDDKLNNKAEEATGATKEGFGKVTGDKETQAEALGEAPGQGQGRD